MRINYVTTNVGKVRSLERHLNPYGIEVIHKPIDLPEPRADDVQVIAEHKARFANGIIKEPLVVLDAGFYIDSLNGFPRAYVNSALDTIGIEGILRLVEGKKRDCEFRHCLAYIDEDLENPECFSSSVKGTIADRARGTMQSHLWSKLGLIFVPIESNKTLGEMTPEEYAEFWKSRHNKDSYQIRFAEWFIQRAKKS